MKITSFLKLCILFVFFLSGSISGWAITYKLTKVTSVSSGNKYVFERNGRVLTTASSSAIQTTDQYSMTGLSGNESYIWQLSSASGGYYMKMSDGKYIKNTDGTNITSTTSTTGLSVWTFTFSDEVVLIQNKSNYNRFLGDNGSDAYKAYLKSDLSTYGNDITVYKLEKEIINTPGVIMHETFTDVPDATLGLVNTSSFDYEDWTMNEDIFGVAGGGSVRLAKQNGAGSITTPVLPAMTTDAIMTINVKGWDADEKTLSVVGENCTVTPSVLDDIPSTYTNYTLKITDVGETPRITFSAASGCRIVIDDVKIMTHVGVKLAASGYATYCSPFALDLTPTDDYAAYAVSSTSGTVVNFSKILGKVAKETPFVLYNPEKAGETVYLPIVVDDEGIASIDGNMLRGTLEPTYVETVSGDYTNFGLSGGKFVKIKSGTVKANKAYLSVLTSSLSAADARFDVAISEETDGVRVTMPSQHSRQVFDLQGRCVKQPTKGLYIIDGKKIVM